MINNSFIFSDWKNSNDCLEGYSNPIAESLISFQSVNRYRLEGTEIMVKKGNIPWNKGKKGLQIPWNKGITGYKMPPASELRKLKMSKAMLGNKNAEGFSHSEETKKKMADARKGIQFSEQHLENLSKSHLGKTLLPESIEKRTATRKENSYTHSEITRIKMGLPQIGELNHNWNGGSSFEPYCPKFNEKLKERIRERDNRTCQYPGCGKQENGRKHHVHHVHYDKPNCDPDLITLCGGHNSTANKRRDYHEELFMKILRERGLAKMEVSNDGTKIITEVK